MATTDISALARRLMAHHALSDRLKRSIQRELDMAAGLPHQVGDGPSASLGTASGAIYGANDLDILQALSPVDTAAVRMLKSLDDLLEKDRLREEDGFPRKIRVGRMVRPGKNGKGKVVVVPTTVEEKLIHDPRFQESQEEAAGGSGSGEEGEVIGEQPVHQPSGGAGTGPGEGEDAGHELESSAYDLGRILTEKFQLPNLKDKGKKRSLTRYTYDLTDRHRGRGQVLDKKATLKKIVETNIHLGNIPNPSAIDPTEFMIAPQDRVYRILSKEKDLESQALVFFLRDYSGSMMGKPTEIVGSLHVLIYSWLLYQYDRQVETRFILHDTEAKEVPDFYTYYNSSVAGGTQVASAFRLVNDIVDAENLARDYNIYVFHGTDGDDWDPSGDKALPQIRRALDYASRVGISVVTRPGASTDGTEVVKYLKNSGLLKDKSELIRMDTLREDADEPRLIEGIRHLTSE
ncbi:MAG: DUF444 family protein [Desulfobacterales bacterium]|jgi:hypothetical protein